MSKDKKKGFSGLGGMLDDVELQHIEAVERNEEPAKESPEHQHKPQPETKPPTESDNRFPKWAWLIVAIALVSWISSGDKKHVSTSSNSSSSGWSAELLESKPQIGSNLTLNDSEILYCVSEEIRIGYLKTLASQYDEGEVDYYNIKTRDYNSRCGTFRYRSGALQRVTTKAEARRSKLEAQALSDFKSYKNMGSLISPAFTPQSQNPISAPNANETPLDWDLIAFKAASAGDMSTAYRNFKLAAEGGLARSQRALGLMYLGGEGVQKDEKEGLKWLRLAADQNDADASYFIGAAYYTGQGLERNMNSASVYFLQAAEGGNSKAQAMIGAMYADGVGVAQDLVLARKWFKEAYDGGEKVAGENLVKLNELETSLKQQSNVSTPDFKIAGQYKCEYAKGNYCGIGLAKISPIENPSQTEPRFELKLNISSPSCGGAMNGIGAQQGNKIDFVSSENSCVISAVWISADDIKITQSPICRDFHGFECGFEGVYNRAASASSGIISNNPYDNLQNVASFSCKDAKTSLEIIICSDSELSQLDFQTGDLYNKKRSVRFATKKSKEKLLTDQRDFLQSRLDRCSIPFQETISELERSEIVTCLKKLYHSRIQNIKNQSSKSEFNQ